MSSLFSRSYRTRIKICGISRLEDALFAVQQGVDALGFVFYPPSPRAVTPAQAAAIVANLPAFVARVGLFVNPEREWVEEVLGAVGLDVLQFHGEESAAACERYGKAYLKAIRVQVNSNVAVLAGEYVGAQGILLDTFVAGVQGGTGVTFDWGQIPVKREFPLILAGGLTPDNVGVAIQAVRPYAVDVSGGVEVAKGIKSAEKIAAFVQAVREADASVNQAVYFY